MKNLVSGASKLVLKPLIIGGSVMTGMMLVLAAGTFTANFPTDKAAGEKLNVGTWNDLMHTVNKLASAVTVDGSGDVIEPDADGKLATKEYVDANDSSGGVTMMSAEPATKTRNSALSYCHDLVSAPEYLLGGGSDATVYDDWDLPTRDEGDLFVGKTSSSNYIWTRTVRSNGNPMTDPSTWVILNLSDGTSSNHTRATFYGVRCVR